MNEHILIVEDEVDIREPMADAIAQAGFAVTVAENGEQGLAEAFKIHPDLILLDLKMPVMDGHEMLKHLRNDPWGKNAKVVILTAMDDVENVTYAHEGKIVDYIIKAHTSLDELIKQVRLALYSTD